MQKAADSGWLTAPRSSVGEAGHALPAKPLALAGISKRYGGVIALQRMSLDIRPGELVSLLGPSGCGKTTTLRLIAGFEFPDSGSIRIGGADIAHLPPNKRGLGMVFQNYSLFPHLNVAENIAFGLRMAGASKAQQAEQVSRMLQMIRLDDYGARKVSQLSGGQQQRVALARALVTNPSVLLLDEPLGALDKNLREGMQFELRALQRKLGITSVMVTHDQEEALTMSDSVVVMNAGRILQVGPPREIYDYPRTRFVAEFLGAANILGYRLVNEEPQAYVLAVLDAQDQPRFELRIPKTERPVRIRRKGELALRPEKIGLADASGAGLGFPGRIVNHVFRGAQHAYQIDVPMLGSMISVYRHAGETEVREAGAQVHCLFKLRDVVVLDAETDPEDEA
ncbi:MAG TPA: ABC transporter ATP-binding protein [Bordetella sp.]